MAFPDEDEHSTGVAARAGHRQVRSSASGPPRVRRSGERDRVEVERLRML
jgi:hypothetical protein